MQSSPPPAPQPARAPQAFESRVDPSPAEPLPPGDDPEAVAQLGRIYSDYLQEKKDAEAYTKKFPKKRKDAVFEQALAKSKAATRKKYEITPDELTLIVKLGDDYYWPVSETKATSPTKPELAEMRRVLDAQKRQQAVEIRVFDEETSRRINPSGVNSPIVLRAGDASRYYQAGALITVASPPCGATNRLGKPCSRKVPGGGKCYVHREQN